MWYCLESFTVEMQRVRCSLALLMGVDATVQADKNAHSFFRYVPPLSGSRLAENPKTGDRPDILLHRKAPALRYFPKGIENARLSGEAG